MAKLPHIISSTLEWLKDPQLVCQFQQYFGIKFINHPPVKNGLIGNSRVSNGHVDGRHLSENQHENTQSESTEETDDDKEHGAHKGPEYVITKPVWYYLFCMGAALGDEAFYACFIPVWFWNIDGAVGRRVVLIWVLLMYIGQGLKDVIRWPRPSSPPVVRLERKWALEYGMPSTHAMIGFSVPVSSFILTMHRYEYPVLLGVVGTVIFCTLVCGSRVYLGMHSWADIVVGLILAMILMVVIHPMLDTIDNFLVTNTWSPVALLVCTVAMLVYVPRSDRWTPTRGDTAVVLGVCLGIMGGSWLNYRLGVIRGPPMPPPYPILWPTYEMMGLTLLRTTIGILILVATRAFIKSLVYTVMCYVLGLDPTDRANRRRLAVELPSKFITYSTMAFNVVYLSARVFQFLNIARVTMHTEI